VGFWQPQRRVSGNPGKRWVSGNISYLQRTRDWEDAE
jgi:hypothetical protein